MAGKTGMVIFWSAERDEQFRTMYFGGVRYCAIAEHFGVTAEAVRQHRRALKLPKRKAPRRGPQLLPLNRITVPSASRAERRKGASEILHPRNGRFDSSAALHRLLERWAA